MPAPAELSAHQLKEWIHDADEVAVLDVREYGQFGEDHLFFAVSLPYSELELHLGRLVPRLQTRVVLYGDRHTEHAVRAAAQIMKGLGYSDVNILKGGTDAWKTAGFACFAGVNLPSKTFGEIAEHIYRTPHISATDLNALLHDSRQKVVVVDGRPVPEYRKMNIPSAICCPNGELPLRIDEIAPDPDTTIVVNCAGRTRSIIGAQTLINLGIPNKVYALENGTQGWYLADLPLEHGSNRLYPRQTDTKNTAALQARSQALRHRFGIPSVDAATVGGWLRDQTRSVFLCDVRTAEEHARADLPPMVQHTPGGQLIQATDQYVGVRKATLVLCDTDGIRAPVVASWLKQLGWKVFLLEDPRSLHDLPRPVHHQPVLRHTRLLAAEHLPQFLTQNPDALLLDARPSLKFREASIAGARWVIRPNVAIELDGLSNHCAVLMGHDTARMSLLAHELEANGCTNIHICVVGAGFPHDTGLQIVSHENMPDDACIDYLFFVHDRHDGNKAAARKYLEWETGLLAQIDERERNTFAFQA
ncbi:sulfurtransferase [Pusillimonas sp. MFBS29]|uniref:rhodanese-like domain-containing protein n=1 Tax=Pusillimonas sp. MFBS29 TaxID=2886690 RepID=UPI001D1297EC|nr:rhodanese-like domain-containing protein [Pusillimonas sp. MFBS29]MCC2596908.1 sulfurtransferase [Pusillimonas sp. MFBS29]